MIILIWWSTQSQKSTAQSLLEVSLSVHCLVRMWPGLSVWSGPQCCSSMDHVVIIVLIIDPISVSPLVIRGHVRWWQPWRRQTGLPLRRRASWSICSAQSPPTDALHRPCHVPWCNPWQRVPHSGESMLEESEWLQKVQLNTYFKNVLSFFSWAKENCNVSVGFPHAIKLNCFFQCYN